MNPHGGFVSRHLRPYTVSAQRTPRGRLIATMLLAAGAVAWSSSERAPIARTSHGPLRGSLLEDGVAVFKGIPYAQPPVGRLRWREPVQMKSWTTVRDATTFGSVCVQRSNVLLPNAKDTSSEDCLFLNVWTPRWPGRPRTPVMVWIPGGGNFIGGSTPDLYDGHRLAARGIVVVSMNYRVGAFGFFAHPKLTLESRHHASGNQGLLDQIAALKWIHADIARFGGDPDNVTIFGESAGSLDASVLMTSPLANGLFHRVIGESGSLILAGDPSPLQDAERRGVALQARWGAQANASLEALRALPASLIRENDPNYATDPPPNLGIVIDGYAVPTKPADVFLAGGEHRVALMLGNNARERVPGTKLPDDLGQAIEAAYGPLAPQAKALYLAAARDPVYGTPAEQWAGDIGFRCSAVAELIWHASAGNRSYQYEFARTPPGMESQGANHGLEIPYVFATLKHLPRMAPAARPDVVDARVSDVMQRYWTTFAASGIPGDPELPSWAAFEPSTRAYMQFTDGGAIGKQGLRRSECDVFMQNVKRLGDSSPAPSPSSITGWRRILPRPLRATRSRARPWASK
jgi:para-nitrobenzyl esterase